jgi:hydroxymethylbilane synthase
MIPAPGQGAIAIVGMKSDEKTNEVLRRINHKQTLAAVLAEREFLHFIGAGCSTPVGALAIVKNGKIFLKAEVLDHSGQKKIVLELIDKLENAKQLGKRAAQIALKRGAKNLLK